MKRARGFVVIVKLVGLDVMEAFEGFWKRAASLEFQENRTENVALLVNSREASST